MLDGVVGLAPLDDDQQRSMILTQLDASEDFTRLSGFSQLRKDHDRVYRDLFPEPPPPGMVPSCAEGGVVGVLPGIIGSLQAMETLKLILGIGSVPLGKLTCYDALNSAFRTLKLNRDPQCRLCGDQPDIHSVSNAETTASAACRASTAT